jgi:hypothetical protein
MPLIKKMHFHGLRAPQNKSDNGRSMKFSAADQPAGCATYAQASSEFISLQYRRCRCQLLGPAIKWVGLGQGRTRFCLRIVHHTRSPRSLPQHRSWDVPSLLRNVRQLCTELFTFQRVHLHSKVAVLFLDVTLESLQVPVAKFHRCGDGLAKSALQYDSQLVQPKAVL